MKNIKNIRHEETIGACGELPDSAPMTKQETARIKAKALGLIATRKHKPKRFASIVAAVICMFTLIACSAEVFNWNYRLSALLNISSEQKKYAETKHLTQNIEKPVSAEDSGIKISLQQVISDENLCYLVFNAELPEKSAYLAEGADIVNELQLEGLTYCANPQTLSLPYDMSPESNIVSFYVVGLFEENSPEKDIPVSIHFKDFTYRTISSCVTTSGKWGLSFTVNKNGDSLNGAVDIPYNAIAENGDTETGRIISYSLSPLSLTLEYIPDRPDPEASCFVYDSAISIRYRNGEEVNVRSIQVETDNMGGYYDKKRNAEVNYLTLCLNQLINIEEVSEIIYNDSVIPITK
ncbi:MAG: DUF4179 domain-containing protein [Christensenellaceae bacterium]|nr:DUF4179 domain-containing protein [Christensenellaceae bacterium]